MLKFLVPKRMLKFDAVDGATRIGVSNVTVLVELLYATILPEYPAPGPESIDRVQL
jgi:hypothetical protein